MAPIAEGFSAGAVSDVPAFATTSLFNVDAGVAQAPVRIQGPTARGGPKMAIGPGPAPGFGAVDTTLGQTIQDFWHLPPGSDALKAYQQDLFDAGLYPDAYYRAKNPKKLNLGVADDVDAKAWHDIALDAARTGRPVTDLLEERKAQMQAAGGVQAAKQSAAASERAPFSSQVTAPLSLAEAAQKAAEKTIGRGFTQSELDRFVKNYHAMEVTADRGVYDNAAAGGVSAAAPAPADAAAQAARQAAPTEAYANDLINVYDQAMAILTRKGTPGGGQ